MLFTSLVEAIDIDTLGNHSKNVPVINEIKELTVFQENTYIFFGEERDVGL